MQLLGQAAIRLLNLVGRSGARDAEDFVWVFHCPSVETEIAERCARYLIRHPVRGSTRNSLGKRAENIFGSA